MNKFESGATTHATNDLILFADNTAKLSKQRDEIYKDWAKSKAHQRERVTLPERFICLLAASKIEYKREFPNPEDHAHIYGMNKAQDAEFCQLYTIDYDSWLQDNKNNIG